MAGSVSRDAAAAQENPAYAPLARLEEARSHLALEGGIPWQEATIPSLERLRKWVGGRLTADRPSFERWWSGSVAQLMFPDVREQVGAELLERVRARLNAAALDALEEDFMNRQVASAEPVVQCVVARGAA